MACEHLMTNRDWIDEMMRRLEGWAVSHGFENAANALNACVHSHFQIDPATHQTPSCRFCKWSFLWEMTGDRSALRKLVTRLAPLMRAAKKSIAPPPKQPPSAPRQLTMRW
jgi:hypothetical protein